jgi:hypothetical protein
MAGQNPVNMTPFFFAIGIALCACSSSTHDDVSGAATVFAVACQPWVDSGCTCRPGSGPLTQGGCPTAVYTCTDGGTYVFSGEEACSFGDAGSQEN